MRILMVNDYFGFSAGAFAVAWELSGELAERGHEVAFLCATENKAQAGRQTIDGREVILLHARTPMRLRPLLTIHRPGLVRRALARAEAFQPDIVHGLLFHLHFSFGLVRGLARRGWPVILQAQDTGLFCPTKYTCQPPDDPARPASALDCLACQRLRYLPGRASLTRFLVNRHAKAVAAASESLAGILEANGLQNVSVIHAGLDPEKMAGRGWSGERFRAHLGLGGEPLILFGGRLQKEKGDEAALRALALIDPALGARLVIAGRPELFGPRLKRLAAELDLTDRVVLAGWLGREQMLGAFRAAKVVLVPSLYPDPFPTINLEAMALGRPV
ncbi:MAG: glycosyltransferase family 4 protein, partial [Deltaproteobacteria bacterium]|nr:glycosyltransferase family 4 protein [Deltaproteobacteria bacterium]